MSKECAKLIKTELKKEFPAIKFKVTGESYTGGNSVDVSYIDGARYCDVFEVVRKYFNQDYDAQSDCYVLTDNEHNLEHRASHIFLDREMSESTRSLVLSKVYARFPDVAQEFFNDYRRLEYNGRVYNTFELINDEFEAKEYN